MPLFTFFLFLCYFIDLFLSPPAIGIMICSGLGIYIFLPAAYERHTGLVWEEKCLAI